MQSLKVGDRVNIVFNNVAELPPVQGDVEHIDEHGISVTNARVPALNAPLKHPVLFAPWSNVAYVVRIDDQKDDQSLSSRIHRPSPVTIAKK